MLEFAERDVETGKARPHFTSCTSPRRSPHLPRERQRKSCKGMRPCAPGACPTPESKNTHPLWEPCTSGDIEARGGQQGSLPRWPAGQHTSHGCRVAGVQGPPWGRWVGGRGSTGPGPPPLCALSRPWAVANTITLMPSSCYSAPSSVQGPQATYHPTSRCPKPSPTRPRSSLPFSGHRHSYGPLSLSPTPVGTPCKMNPAPTPSDSFLAFCNWDH